VLMVLPAKPYNFLFETLARVTVASICFDHS
jgi:hypothetical protein